MSETTTHPISYTPPPKNTRGIQVATSWARACGLTVTKSTSPRGDFGIQRKDGTVLNVRAYAFATVAPEPDLVQIPAQQLQSCKREISLPAFHQITRAAGFGTPTPVDRGAVPSHAEIYGKDIFLSAVRHRELRDSPNLSKAKEAYYRPVVERVSHWAARKGQFAPFGYERDDLKTYAWCWATIYAHRYEVPSTNLGGQDNYRLLSRFLRQRYSELAVALKSRADHNTDRDDIPEPVDCSMLPDEALAQQEDVSDDDEVDDNPQKRKKEAGVRLRQRLGEMPHDKMIEALVTQSTNPLRDEVTRKQARRLLVSHQADCAACGGVQVMGSKWKRGQSSSGAAP